MSNLRHRIAWFAVVPLGLLAGCGATPDQPAWSAAMNSTQPKIELLGFPGCPNTPTMRVNLKSALGSVGKGWTFTDINQEQLPEGDIRRGYPTPTVLVNDRDLYGLPVPTAPSMGCRMYTGGVPDANDIAGKVKAATAR